MLKRFAHAFITAVNYTGSVSEKTAVFLCLVRLLAKRVFFRQKNGQVRESFFGFQVYGFSPVTLEYLFREIFINREYFFEARTTNPVIVDCGANIGMSILYFKKLFPGARILAFEPNPFVFKLLQNNLAVNGIQNVTTYNLGLYDSETEIPFFINDDVGTLMGSINQGRGGKTQLSVKTVKLSDHLKAMRHVDLVKMDVEGAEANIISDLFDAGAINIAKEYIIEFHHNVDNQRSNLATFLQKFETAGFNYTVTARPARKNSFQDIRLHFYKSDLASAVS